MDHFGFARAINNAKQNFNTMLYYLILYRYHISGQMIYMENWRMIMFLGTPVMPELTSLINTGTK